MCGFSAKVGSCYFFALLSLQRLAKIQKRESATKSQTLKNDLETSCQLQNPNFIQEERDNYDHKLPNKNSDDEEPNANPKVEELILNPDDKEPILNPDDDEPILNSVDEGPILNPDDEEPILNPDDEEPI